MFSVNVSEIYLDNNTTMILDEQEVKACSDFYQLSQKRSKVHVRGDNVLTPATVFEDWTVEVQEDGE